MHKSKGNAIWFDDAAEEIGVDVMRWLFATRQPERQPQLRLPHRRRGPPPLHPAALELLLVLRHLRRARRLRPHRRRRTRSRWPSARCSTAGSSPGCNQLVAEVRDALDDYDPDRAAQAIERFVVDELSNWYIRRNRRRFWKSESDADKAAAYQTLYECLTTLAQLLAPFMPFLAEAMYQNLVRSVDPTAPESVHLTDYPAVDRAEIDAALSRDMAAVLEVVRLGRAARSEASVKVRQPLPALLVHARDPAVLDAVVRLQDQVLDELNVKDVAAARPSSATSSPTTSGRTWRVLGPKYGKRLGAIRAAPGAGRPGRRRRSGSTPVRRSTSRLRDGSTVALDAGRDPGRSDQARGLRRRPGSARDGRARHHAHAGADPGGAGPRLRPRRPGRPQERRLPDRGPDRGRLRRRPRGRRPRSTTFADYVRTEVLADDIDGRNGDRRVGPDRLGVDRRTRRRHHRRRRLPRPDRGRPPPRPHQVAAPRKSDCQLPAAVGLS